MRTKNLLLRFLDFTVKTKNGIIFTYEFNR